MCLCCSFSFGSLNPSSILFCSALCFGRLTSLHLLHPDSLISDFQWDSVHGKLPEGKRRKRCNIDPLLPQSSHLIEVWILAVSFFDYCSFQPTLFLSPVLGQGNLVHFVWPFRSNVDKAPCYWEFSLLFLHPLWVPQTLPIFLWKSLLNDIFNKLFSYTISRPSSVHANIWVTLYLNWKKKFILNI